MRLRDPRDKRYPERLSASYLASLILHALMAVLLFTLASSSSQEGASETQQGGEIITIERRAPVQPQTAQTATSTVAKAVQVTPPQPVPPSVAPPVPHAPVAPRVQHAPQNRPATRHWQLRHQELARITPNGSPNPPPVPKAPIVPQAVPTQPVFEPSPLPQAPVAPVNVNTPLPLTVAVKNPPTAAPSPKPTPKPVPSHVPERPRPVPSETPHPVPTEQPHPASTPRVAVTTPAPESPAPKSVAAVATKAPQTVSNNPTKPSQPAKSPGVPSPAPTRGPSLTSSGTHATPGPKGHGTPGHRKGSGSANRKGPERPVHVPPSTTTGGLHKPTAAQMNAKLRALIPTGSVTPTSKSYGGGAAYLHPQLVPTPPPDVVAHTKYIYQSTDTSGSGERLVKMWVTSVTHIGPIIWCTGWLVRYPAPPPMAASGSSVPNLLSISIGGGSPHTVASGGAAGQDPIIETHASYVCPAHSLTPFKPQ